ncbi:MAG: hypothetical protein HY423_13320 [Candidatus Lambdaproteobacteria bacterium]|nr:hypothetical protein [Candidatus Lambdaproteobacteria bacterium]
MTENLGRLIGRPATIANMPVTMRYLRSHIQWEAAKGFAGAACCFGVLIWFQPHAWFGWTVGGLGAFFLYYFLVQVRNAFVRYRLDDTGLTEEFGGRKRVLRWGELRKLRLHFFSPKRSKLDQGTLHLTLWGNGSRFKLDSTLDHFPTLLRRSAQAARSRELYLDPTTLSNLEQLGL